MLQATADLGLGEPGPGVPPGAAGEPPPRRPGGRPPGSLNKVTREIRTAAAAYGRRSVRALWKLATTSENEVIRLRALVELLDRGFGKSVQPTELTGAGGRPLVPDVLDGHADGMIEVGRRIAFVLGSAAREAPTPGVVEPFGQVLTLAPSTPEPETAPSEEVPACNDRVVIRRVPAHVESRPDQFAVVGRDGGMTHGVHPSIEAAREWVERRTGEGRI